MNKTRRSSRCIALLLAVCILFVIMYLMVFEETHEIHKCTGPDCPICHQLQIAEQFIKQFSTAGVIIAASLIYVVGIQSIHATYTCLNQGRTLILDKVRMDN